MTFQQKRTLLLLSLVGLAYFLLFFYPNSYGAATRDILRESSGDEYVVYPNIEQMLTLGRTFSETRANIFFYNEYHYGFPYFAYSALVLLPLRWIEGEAFFQQLQGNLLLLRQFVSVLPMILAAGVLVYVQTRFQRPLKALALFVFLLSVRGIVRNNLWWWHPDALAVLAVALTIFFLDRDNLRFGRSFYLAAFCCGLATAIKLSGVFFFLAIPLYLILGLLNKRIGLARAALAAAGFAAILAAVTVLANPVLFSDTERARLLEIQAEKQGELSRGYEHDDPRYYAKGPQWWASTLEKWYGSPLFLLFLAVSVIAGAVWGPRRLANQMILAWAAPYTIYLLWFVAVKPDHYWLPVLLPVFSAAFVFLDLLLPEGTALRQLPRPRQAWLGLVLVVLVGQFALHLFRPVSGNLPLYAITVQTGQEQLRRLGR